MPAGVRSSSSPPPAAQTAEVKEEGTTTTYGQDIEFVADNADLISGGTRTTSGAAAANPANIGTRSTASPTSNPPVGGGTRSSTPPRSNPVDTLVQDRKSTRLNSSHSQQSRMPSSA